jgi:putative NIF3 family GTP cyclohydrolase 1 type 2
MKIDEVIKTIEKVAPLTIQSEWDNSGLNIGDRENNITNILICLDNKNNTCAIA